MPQDGFSLFENVAKKVAKTTNPTVSLLGEAKEQTDQLQVPRKTYAPLPSGEADPRGEDFPYLAPFGLGNEISQEPALDPDPLKIEYEYGEPFLGAKAVVKRRRPVLDETKITQIVSVRDLDLKEQDVMEANYATSKPSDAYPEGEVFGFMPEDDYETRLNILDQGKAVSLSYQVGDNVQTVPIPYDELIEDLTSLPENIKDKIPTYTTEENYMYMINTGVNDEINRAIFANQFVNFLRNQGVKDDRTIAGIVSHSVNLPQFGGFGFGDASKLVGLGTEIVKFPFEAGAYVIGEAYDAITEDMDTEGFDLGDSVDRQRFFDRYFPRMAAAVQDRYTQLGLDVSYPVAEAIARRFSGIGTQAVATTAEVVGPTKTGTLLKRGFDVAGIGFGGANEARMFKNWSDDYTKRFPNESPEAVMRKYIDIRKSQMFGKDVAGLSQELYDIKLIGGVAKIAAKPIAFINGIRISSRFRAGMQLEDAALAVDNRIEVRNMTRYRTNLQGQKNGIIDRARSEGRDLNPSELERLAEVDRKLDVTNTELRSIVAQSEVPKFMREAARQDKYIVIGSVAANQAFEAFGGDPALGEFVGVLGGIGYSLLRGRNEAKTLLKKFNLEKASDTKLMDAADMILTNMGNLDPDFQEALLTRVKYFEGLKQELLQVGVNPEVLNRSVIRMMGLSVLQVIEEGHRIEMNGPQAAGFGGNFQALTENLALQQKFAAELRTTLQTLANAEGVQLKGTAVNKLYETVDAALKHADGMIRQLDSDLEVLGRNYEKHVKGQILGGSENLQALSDGSVADLRTTFDNLAEHNISQIDNKSVEAIRNEVRRTDASLLDAVKQKANQIGRALPTQGDVQNKVEKVLPDGRIIRPGRAPVKNGQIQTAGDALAAVVESANLRERNIASAPYRKLDAEVFVTSTGQRIQGTPTTDAGPVLDEMFNVLGTDDGITILLEMSGKTLSRSQSSKTFAFLDDVAGGFLSTIAERQGVSVDDLVNDAIQAAGDYDKRIPRNLFAAMQIRKDLAAQDIDVGVLPMTFIQAKELTDALGQMAFKAPEAASAKIRNLENIAEGTMDSFSVRLENGQVITLDQLYVADEASPTGTSSVREYLARANEGWSEYKRRFYDDENLSKWLGWSDKKARKPVGNSVDYPLGIDYGKNAPTTWLNLDKVADAKPEEQARLMRSLAEGIGQLDPTTGTYRIALNSAEGQAFREVLGAHMREWMINTVTSGKPIDFNEFRRKAASLENAFVGFTEDGKEIAMIDSKRIMRDVFPDFGTDALNEDIFNAGVEKMNSAIKREAARVTKEATVIKNGLQDSRKYLERFSAGRLDAADAASVLISGGTARVAEVKQHLKLLGRTDDEINAILKALIVDEVEKKAFKLTAVHTPDPANPTILIPEVDLDDEQLKTIMGFNDPAQREVVKSIVGKDTYKVYESIVQFVANEKLAGVQGLNMTGIPRKFSIESYISRFYAINRGVVSFRYVGTEAVLQEMRRKNMSILSMALTTPKVGEYLMEMIATGKPLPAQKENELFELMVIGMERFDNWRERSKDPVKVVSDYGHEFIFNAVP